jgi:isopentenyl-diphosphate Delta-isomerase
MPDELIDVIDEEGNSLNTQMMKSEAHKKGLWHHASHLWIRNKEGQFLLQKRAKQKELSPGVWDVVVGGHVSAGETPDQAVLRETEEEIGLKISINDIKKLGSTKKIGEVPSWRFPHREHIHMYLYTFEGNIADLKLQEEEVEELKFMLLETFEKEIRDPEKKKFYVPDTVYQLYTIELIKKLT